MRDERVGGGDEQEPQKRGPSRPPETGRRRRLWNQVEHGDDDHDAGREADPGDCAALTPAQGERQGDPDKSRETGERGQHQDGDVGEFGHGESRARGSLAQFDDCDRNVASSDHLVDYTSDDRFG